VPSRPSTAVVKVKCLIHVDNRSVEVGAYLARRIVRAGVPFLLLDNAALPVRLDRALVAGADALGARDGPGPRFVVGREQVIDAGGYLRHRLARLEPAADLALEVVLIELLQVLRELDRVPLQPCRDAAVVEVKGDVDRAVLDRDRRGRINAPLPQRPLQRGDRVLAPALDHARHQRPALSL